MFEIYFQSGEFVGESSSFWISVFKDFLMPALGVGVPLYIFYVGINNQRIDDANKAQIIHAEKLKYLSIKVLKIIEYTTALRNVVDDSLTQTEFQIRNTPRVDLPASNEITRLVEKLDHESFLRAYTAIMVNDHASLNSLFDTLDEINLIGNRLERILIDFSQLLEPFEAEFREAFTNILSEIQLLELSNSAPPAVFAELREARNIYFANEMKAIEDKINVDYEMIFIDQIVNLTATYVGQGRGKFEKILLLARDFHPRLVGYNLRSVRLQNDLRKIQTAIMGLKVDLIHYSIDLRSAEKSGKFDKIIASSRR